MGARNNDKNEVLGRQDRTTPRAQSQPASSRKRSQRDFHATSEVEHVDVSNQLHPAPHRLRHSGEHGGRTKGHSFGTPTGQDRGVATHNELRAPGVPPHHGGSSSERTKASIFVCRPGRRVGINSGQRAPGGPPSKRGVRPQDVGTSRPHKRQEPIVLQRP